MRLAQTSAILRQIALPAHSTRGIVGESIYPASPEAPLPVHLGARTSIPGRNPSTRI
jgi:hypothetical protein